MSKSKQYLMLIVDSGKGNLKKAATLFLNRGSKVFLYKTDSNQEDLKTNYFEVGSPRFTELVADGSLIKVKDLSQITEASEQDKFFVECSYNQLLSLWSSTVLKIEKWEKGNE